MNRTNKYTKRTSTRTGIRLALMVLVLFVSGCAQAAPPTVATQSTIVPPAATEPMPPAATEPMPPAATEPMPPAATEPMPPAATEPMPPAAALSPTPLEQHDHDATTATAGQTTSVAPLLGNLGDHTHAITTADPRAQQYFDEGLTLAYGFNHAEAIRSFKDATTLDPGCAMCYWGIALALGPNINAPMEDAAVPDAYQAIQQALKLAPDVGEREQAYIQALATRYAAEPVADRASLDLVYADAMRVLSQSYPDDLDAATLLAEALMNLSPWNYWAADGTPTTYTDEIVTTLEAIMARDASHPGANHYYIHAVEASKDPDRAVPSAERLAQLVPGVGHLVHMPAHIYWRVGRYHDAVVANEHAIHSDETYIPDRNAQGGFYSLAYYPHNIHFLFAGAHMEGNSKLAIDAARKLIAEVPEESYREIPMLEDFKPMPLFALVRFGKWDDVLREPQPAPEFVYTTGMWHWARGMAFVRQGELDKAAEHQQHLATIAAMESMKEFTLWSFETADKMLAIASGVLTGELAGARGEPEEMIVQLQQAVTIQDGLAYMEPPPWYYPVRHNLGAALLDQGRAVEAEAVYRKDLEQFRKNGWSLFGLAASLRAQDKMDEAAEVQKQFEAAWQHADIDLTASRY